MGLIKKPAEIEAKKTLNALIYGQPGMGKTTLACSSLRPVLFDFDGGIDRIKAEHRPEGTLQVTKWEEVAIALQEVREARCFNTIVIDTIGKMLDCITDYIARTYATDRKMVWRDSNNCVTLSLKAYGIRKQIWKQFLSDANALGIDVLFVAQEKEDKDDKGNFIKRADAGNATTANDLFKDLDLIGYLSAQGVARTLDFEGSETINAKAPTSMRKKYNVEVVVDKEGNVVGTNDYFNRVVKGDYNQFQSGNNALGEAYNALIADANAEIGAVATPEDANKVLADIKKIAHIWDSKLVVWYNLKAKAEELGFTYDKEAKQFVAPAPEVKTKGKGKKAEANGDAA